MTVYSLQNPKSCSKSFLLVTTSIMKESSPRRSFFSTSQFLKEDLRVISLMCDNQIHIQKIILTLKVTLQLLHQTFSSSLLLSFKTQRNDFSGKKIEEDEKRSKFTKQFQRNCSSMCSYFLVVEMMMFLRYTCQSWKSTDDFAYDEVVVVNEGHLKRNFPNLSSREQQ